MRVLFIAPLPPPINGQSIAAQLLLQNLKNIVDVDIVNMSKTSHKDGMTSFSRIIEVINFFKQIARYRHTADVIYLQISESVFGNIKDIIIYVLCRKKLNRVFIHLHGGSFGKQILEKNIILEKINAFFLKRINAVIVLGLTHRKIFEKYFQNDKIHVIPNFYLPEFLIEQKNVSRKFNSNKKLKFLYLSNMIPKKGYSELFEAFLLLEESIKQKIELDFAGRFGSLKEESSFKERISSWDNVKYHGVVSGGEKVQLLADANVFILPTSYNEGQPISILEAYASGCVVIVTLLGGIPDIFNNNVNGLSLSNTTPEVIANAMLYCVENIKQIESMAVTNHSISLSSYSTSFHIKKLLDLLLNIE